jgi:hypothetical protein
MPRKSAKKTRSRRSGPPDAPLTGITRRTTAGTIRRPLRAFANEVFTVLRYGEQVTLNPGSGSNASYVFAMNGLYDPNITGTGHQPYGFDEYCAAAGAGPYNRYTVVKSRLHAWLNVPALQGATPGTADGRAAAFISVNARRENSSNFANLYNNIEDPSIVDWTMCTQFQGRELHTPWIDLAQYFGLKKSVFDSDLDWSGTYAANPGTLGYWIISASTTAQSVIDPIDVYVTALIEYEVRFWSQNVSVASVTLPQLLSRVTELETVVAHDHTCVKDLPPPPLVPRRVLPPVPATGPVKFPRSTVAP